MRYVQYKDEKTKEDERAVNVSDVLLLMNEMEDFNGTTKEKIVENYYELKRQIRNILFVEEQGGDKEK